MHFFVNNIKHKHTNDSCNHWHNKPDISFLHFLLKPTNTRWFKRQKNFSTEIYSQVIEKTITRIAARNDDRTMNRDELWAFPQVGKFYDFSQSSTVIFLPILLISVLFDSLLKNYEFLPNRTQNFSYFKRISLWFINFTFLMNLCMQLTALFQFFWTFFTLHCWEAF